MLQYLLGLVIQFLFRTLLGVYDLLAPGLVDEHDVGIFRKSDSSLVVSATVGSGTSALFEPGTVAGTRLVDVSPTALMAGTAYYILANNWFNDTYAFGDSSVTFAPEVLWNGFVDTEANDINAAPLFFGGEAGNIGPSFQYTVQTVSVPASGVLISAGLVVLSWGRRQRSVVPTASV